MKSDKMPICLFRGDDTDFIGNKTIAITVETDIDLSGITAKFTLCGFEQTFTAVEVVSKRFEIVISHEQTRQFPLGLQKGSLILTDSSGKIKHITTEVPFFVTDSTKHMMFSGDEEIVISFGEYLDWEHIQNKPNTLEGYGITDGATKTSVDELAQALESIEVSTVKSVNGIGPGANGNVNIDDGTTRPLIAANPGSAGQSRKVARADHVHPAETTIRNDNEYINCLVNGQTVPFYSPDLYPIEFTYGTLESQEEKTVTIESPTDALQIYVGARSTSSDETFTSNILFYNDPTDQYGGVVVAFFYADNETNPMSLSFIKANTSTTVTHPIKSLTFAGQAPFYFANPILYRTQKTSVYVRGVPVPLEDDARFVSKSELLDMIYPVGSIYMSIVGASPESILGGTWERLTGKFLLGATPNGQGNNERPAGYIGGEANHVLTINELPQHTHGSKSLTGTWSTEAWNGVNGTGIVSKTASSYNRKSPGGGSLLGSTSFKIDATHEHSSVGLGESHNNMPPFLSVYMWRRTA